MNLQTENTDNFDGVNSGLPADGIELQFDYEGLNEMILNHGMQVGWDDNIDHADFPDCVSDGEIDFDCPKEKMHIEDPEEDSEDEERFLELDRHMECAMQEEMVAGREEGNGRVSVVSPSPTSTMRQG